MGYHASAFSRALLCSLLLACYLVLSPRYLVLSLAVNRYRQVSFELPYRRFGLSDDLTCIFIDSYLCHVSLAVSHARRIRSIRPQLETSVRSPVEWLSWTRVS